MKPIVQYRIGTTDGDIVIETDKEGGAVLHSPFEHDESLLMGIRFTRVDLV